MAIVFLGNSGAARECYWILRLCQEHDPGTPPFKGFLAWHGFPDNLHELSCYSLGNSDTYSLEPEDRFVIALGKPSLRRAAYAWLKERGARFHTLIHPNVYICPSATYGEASIFTGGCAILANVSIGNCNYFNGSITAGHDSVIGDFNVFNLCTHLFGNVRIGNGNLTSPQTLLLQNSRIGSCNTFAPASVVYRGCGDYCHMAGNPALIERRLEHDHA